MALLLVTLGLSFTGYLLPWDQLAFWAVTIGANMAEKAPVGGNEANLLLRGAATIGPNGLLRFYLLHVIFLGVGRRFGQAFNADADSHRFSQMKVKPALYSAPISVPFRAPLARRPKR